MKKINIVIRLVAIITLVFYAYHFVVWNVGPLQKAKHTIRRHQSRDRATLVQFQQQLRTRIMALESNSGQFLDELQGLGLIWNTVTFNKNEYVQSLWEEHFGQKVQTILADMLEGLFTDIKAHQNAALVEVSQELDLELMSGLRLQLEKEIFVKLEHLTLQEVQTAANMTLGGEVVALIAGTLAGTIVAQVIKSTPLTIIIGILVDVVVSSTLNGAVKKRCRQKIHDALMETADVLLDGDGQQPGILQVMDEWLLEIHSNQEKTIMAAVESGLWR